AGHEVRAVVADEAGRALAGIAYEVLDAAGGRVAGGVTDRAGAIRAPVTPGRYRVCLAAHEVRAVVLDGDGRPPAGGGYGVGAVGGSLAGATVGGMIAGPAGAYVGSAMGAYAGTAVGAAVGGVVGAKVGSDLESGKLPPPPGLPGLPGLPPLPGLPGGAGEN